MSIYTMRNVVSKYVKNNINVLYACPPDMKPIEELNSSELNKHNVFIYSTNDIMDLSWFTYDVLLTHQINDQIINMSLNLHIPILCYKIKDIPDLLERFNNSSVYVFDKESQNNDLISVITELKNKRFIL
jgi:hypothetical protein